MVVAKVSALMSLINPKTKIRRGRSVALFETVTRQSESVFGALNRRVESECEGRGWQQSWTGAAIHLVAGVPGFRKLHLSVRQ